MRRAVAVAVCCTLAVACGEPSPVDPQARVEIRGAAEYVGGGPVAGGTVLVMKEIGFDEFAADMPAFFGTMGLVCLTNVELDVCDESGTKGETSADGTFRVELTGRDVQSGFGTTSTLWATVAGPQQGGGAGPSVSHAFQATSEAVKLPAMRVWDPQVRVARRGNALEVDWDAFPRELGRKARDRAVVQTTDGAALWSVGSRGEALDPRLLEDATAFVAAEAEVGRDADVGTRVYRSRQQPIQGAGPPPSRGAGCSAVATARERVAYDPCPLTDGDLSTSFDPALEPQCPQGRKCPQHDTAVILDLGEARAGSLLVIRGDEDRLVVDTAVAPGQWQRLETVKTRQGCAVVEIPNGIRLRYVRLRAARWPLPGFTEVSVW